MLLPRRSGLEPVKSPTEGNLCGQADIVIEYSNSMSFPLLQGNQSRLYLAESVCCVVEVKSNLQAQWDDVVAKAEKVSNLRRNVNAVLGFDPPPPKVIPTFAVGFHGWKTEQICRDKLKEAKAPSLSGLLVLDPPGIYVGGEDYHDSSMPEGPSIDLRISSQHRTTDVEFYRGEACAQTLCGLKHQSALRLDALRTRHAGSLGYPSS
jgi:hypothetical protein